MRHRPPYFGAAYYPEDWPLEQIDADIALMKKAGMNVMRTAEFAWSRMEPREGHYDFDWLHLAVDKLGKAGIATIMGTPTCAPPAWLTERYPETLALLDNGQRRRHGARRQFCPNSPVYRDHCARIVTRLAEEFGRDANVIGWQIDNELYFVGNRGCCCSVCHRKFQDWLRSRFGGIEALNAAWCANLWSQTYQSFGQIPIPVSGEWSHPALLTAWMKFQADSYVEYCARQAAILRRLARQPAGTDMMPVYGLSYYDMNQALDVVQYNHYHDPGKLWQNAFWLDHCRTIKPAAFWNTETSACWYGGVTAYGYRDPGFCRANSWMPFALGGEACLYWLWRAHWSGQELMHGSVIQSCGRPMHMFAEVREVASGLRKAAGFLRGTRPLKSGLALHLSHFAWLMFEHQPIVNGFRYNDRIFDYYHELIQAQLRPDVIDTGASLEDYRLICTPFAPALDEHGLRERLGRWIRGGGTWVAGPLTDIRNLDAAKFVHAPFGGIEEWAGMRCAHGVPGDPREFHMRWRDGTESEGSWWYDGLEPRGARVLARYLDGPAKGLAAVTEKRMGRGRVIVLGTLPRGAELQRLLSDLAREAGMSAAAASPNLLAAPRSGKAGEGMVVVEMENQPAALELPRPATDLLSGKRYRGKVEIPPYGVMAFKH